MKKSLRLLGVLFLISSSLLSSTSIIARAEGSNEQIVSDEVKLSGIGDSQSAESEIVNSELTDAEEIDFEQINSPETNEENIDSEPHEYLKNKPYPIAIAQGMVTETIYDSEFMQVTQTYPSMVKANSRISIEIKVKYKQKLPVWSFTNNLHMSYTDTQNPIKIVDAFDSNGKTYSSVNDGGMLLASNEFLDTSFKRKSIEGTEYKLTYNVQAGENNFTLKNYVAYDDSAMDNVHTVADMDHLYWDINIGVEPVVLNMKFDSNNGSLVEAQAVTSGEKAIRPTDPTKDGYTFDGWYVDEALTQLFDFDTPITQATTLYAKWIENALPVEKYPVDFNSNGGSSIPSESIMTNEKVTKPTDPTKEGYTFGGWYVDAALTQLFDFDTPITQATTLYAKWIENTLPVEKYPVDFNSNGGSSIPSESIMTNEKVMKPTDPTKEGYTFGGWYVDAALTQLFDFDTPITQAMTLYAKWAAHVYEIKFDSNGGTGTMNNNLLQYDSTVTITNNRFFKDGYTFIGWNTKADGSGTYYKNSADVKNLTDEDGKVIIFYAQWKKETTPPDTTDSSINDITTNSKSSTTKSNGNSYSTDPLTKSTSGESNETLPKTGANSSYLLTILGMIMIFGTFNYIRKKTLK